MSEWQPVTLKEAVLKANTGAYSRNFGTELHQLRHP
jgi:hypothetical protein